MDVLCQGHRIFESHGKDGTAGVPVSRSVTPQTLWKGAIKCHETLPLSRYFEDVEKTSYILARDNEVFTGH